MHILLAGNLTDHVVAHDLFHIGSIGVTNQMVMTLVVGVVMLLVFPRLFNRPSPDAPSGARNFFESILEFLRLEVFRPALKEHTDRFVPFLWSLFFFILFSNLLGLIPFATIIELFTRGKAEHWGGTPTGNLSNTAALAICAFIVIHASGILQVARDLMRGTYGHHGAHEEHSSDGTPSHEAAMDLEHMRAEALPADVPQQFSATTDPTRHYHDDEHVHHYGHGIEGGGLSAQAQPHGMNPVGAALLAVPLYLWNFAPHPFRPQPGEPATKWLMDIPMWLMLLVLELLGAVIKPFALSIRLFANMIAGHLVLAALLTLIVASPRILVQLGVAVPVIILSLLIWFLEIFVAFLQAYVFTFLATLFVASAVAPEH